MTKFHIAGLVEWSISFCVEKNHEWKAMGRVIYGSRKTAFFEEKKANFAARLNWTTHRANRVCVGSLDCKSSRSDLQRPKNPQSEASVLESNPTLSLRRKEWSDTDRGANVTPAQV
jgi:hypothetical protein